ncbi:MAG: bifunctional phosphoribosylaminoimidazolecarboxamide formyltransferase/IMP cyclohydrolase [Thermodesulfobacteriota bacterium]
MNKINRVIISVSDKEGISNFAKGLEQYDVEILSTGGTAKQLRDSGVSVMDISEYTGSPEILDGRVKTLHPKIYGGVLALRDNETHIKQMKENDMESIDMIVVNLYPFEEVIKKENVDLMEAIENIDIGGPTMLRAAAKNYQHVTLVTHPEDYADLLTELKDNDGSISAETNFKLAVKAFSYVARYDAAISNFLGGIDENGEKTKFPPSLTVHMDKKMKLRYGENPHQEGSFYVESGLEEPCISNSIQLQGKELSLNNIYDTDAALEAVKDYKQGACVVVKHNNPCGVATDESVVESFLKAKACDPVSSFGGIVAFNREVDEATATELAAMFLEVVIAPGYSDKALEVLSSKTNLRVMKTPDLPLESSSGLDFKKVIGGALIQDRDTGIDRDFDDMKVATKRQPTDEELRALKFGWTVCKHVKSNAIVFARDGQTVGIGAGQMSRVDSVKIATIKAELPTEGATLASDAFFPFRDGIDEAAKAGITAIVQPGGSIRDQDIIDACDEHDIAMVFTGFRHFKH